MHENYQFKRLADYYTFHRPTGYSQVNVNVSIQKSNDIDNKSPTIIYYIIPSTNHYTYPSLLSPYQGPYISNPSLLSFTGGSYISFNVRACALQGLPRRHLRQLGLPARSLCARPEKTKLPIHRPRLAQDDFYRDLYKDFYNILF